jgi:WD40 repeat protein
MVTSDFINPISSINPSTSVVVRGSIRVWDLANREITRTISLPVPAGMLDVDLIPGDPQGRASTSSTSTPRSSPDPPGRTASR